MLYGIFTLNSYNKLLCKKISFRSNELGAIHI